MKQGRKQGPHGGRGGMNRDRHGMTGEGFNDISRNEGVRGQISTAQP